MSLPIEQMEPSIGLRELRQNASEYLRQVERGQTFVVTVQGREVGELRPHRRQWQRMSQIAGLFGSPTDTSSLDDSPVVELVDPWEQS